VRRILLVLTVALVMVAMVVATAAPSFAQGEGGVFTSCFTDTMDKGLSTQDAAQFCAHHL
jgi:hypothetical protein